MGTVLRQEKIGDSSITLSFENYQDFLDYQKKEREQDALDVAAENNQLQDLLDAFNAPKSCYRLELTKDEYYYLSCILGHLVPAGEISKSLLDKVSTYELDSDDFDKIQFAGDTIGGYSIKLVEEN